MLRHYISALKERDELDALVPDLLTQMGAVVYSRPRRGTRQFGVDIAATLRSVSDEIDSVLLLSLKAGDITRPEWNGPSAQALRPSLDEVLEVYIPSHLPPELRGKTIRIVLCFSGSVREDVRLHLSQYINKNTKNGVTFEEWDADRLAELVEKYLLNEHLLPSEVRPAMRKALALLDEPEASYQHFCKIARALEKENNASTKKSVTPLRQISVCVWMLYTWAREAENLEAPYRAAEMTMLWSWDRIKNKVVAEGGGQIPRELLDAFSSSLRAFLQVSGQYFSKISQSADVYLSLSINVESSTPADVNLRIFDCLGRIALFGIWQTYLAKGINDEAALARSNIVNIIKYIIINNPTLQCPLTDDHVVEIGLVSFLLSLGTESDRQFLAEYLQSVVDSAFMAYHANGPYPTMMTDYRDLISHPLRRDNEYKEMATASSELFPAIALWGSVVGSVSVAKDISEAKASFLKHCAFQIWFPGDDTDSTIYRSAEASGISLIDVSVMADPREHIKAMAAECGKYNAIAALSSLKYGFPPVLLTACRHYRKPVPAHFALLGIDGNIRRNEGDAMTKDNATS